jgi:hypothetical protein
MCEHRRDQRSDKKPAMCAFCNPFRSSEQELLKAADIRVIQQHHRRHSTIYRTCNQRHAGKRLLGRHGGEF